MPILDVEKKNSDNFKNAKFENSPVNIHIGDNASPLIIPINAFCHNKFIKALDHIDKIMEDYNHDSSSISFDRDMDKKNDLNRVSKTYYEQSILPNLKDNFREIDAILKQGRMSAIAERYQTLGRDLTKNYISQEKSFEGIAQHIESVCDLVYTRSEELIEKSEKDMVSLVLHHMYYQCFYGIREDDRREANWE